MRPGTAEPAVDMLARVETLTDVRTLMPLFAGHA